MKTLRNTQEGGGGEEGQERSRMEGEEKSLARCFKAPNYRSRRRRQMILLNSNVVVAIGGK